jgi:hypothetical protein
MGDSPTLGEAEFLLRTLEGLPPRERSEVIAAVLKAADKDIVKLVAPLALEVPGLGAPSAWSALMAIYIKTLKLEEGYE